MTKTHEQIQNESYAEKVADILHRQAHESAAGVSPARATWKAKNLFYAEDQEADGGCEFSRLVGDGLHAHLDGGCESCTAEHEDTIGW